jgi:hypothetical protein
MKRLVFCAVLVLLMAAPGAAQKPFPVVSTVNAPTLAGRPVQLYSEGKLLP